MRHRERWPEVKSLLAQALEIMPEERPALFARQGAEPAVIAEVEELLALGQQADGFIDEPLFSFRQPTPALEAGSRLGPWRLLRPLGQGGMGTVYLAERADGAFELTVAVKLLKIGFDSAELISRFEAERHILARLIHPNIARLLDGGTSADGRPYLVMEHVEGEPIDQHCDRRRLSTRARLELFRDVCSAVQLAHQNLVVHRDLKPANILVTAEGTVKLLDFGIAKLLAPQPAEAEAATSPTLAQLGGAPLTPRYASPEQVRGEPITTASDVYSLGVVLYELLTGHRPYRFETLTPAEVERVVCGERPPRPSTAVRRTEEVATADDGRLLLTPEAVAGLREGDVARLSRRLAGDLDTILLTALSKEPKRRFASAEQLSEDLRLYLAGLPIRSQPDAFGYRARKFLVRHALGVTLAAAGLALLLAFAGAMTWQRSEIAARSREVAQERDRAEATKEFLLELIGQTDPRLAKGQEITIRQALDQRSGDLAKETDLAPATRADLLDALGVAYRSHGRYEKAVPLLRQALALREQELGKDHVQVAESLHNLANVERSLDRPDEAERLIRRALAIQRRAFPQGHKSLARGLNNLASLVREKAEETKGPEGALFAEAETLAREGLAMKQRLFGERNGEVALSLNTLATILVRQGKPAEAEPLLRQSIALRRALDGPISPGLAKSINNLAELLATQGRLTEAEALHRESLAIRRKLYPQGHQELLASLQRLGRLRARQGDGNEAAVLAWEAREMAKQSEAKPELP